jgi:hypothetical protein
MENKISNIEKTLELILVNQQKIFEAICLNGSNVTDMFNVINMQSHNINNINNQILTINKVLNDITIQMYHSDDSNKDVLDSLQDINNECTNIKNSIDNIKIYKMVDY